MKFKKLAAVIAAALVLATSAVCLTACGGDTTPTNDTSVQDSTMASLAGTRWDITGITVDGTVKSVEELEQQYGSDLDMYFYFTDSTVTANLMGSEDTTSYTYANGVLTIEGESTTIVGDTMTFVVDGQTIMLKKSADSSISNIGTGTVTNTDTSSVISVDVPAAPSVNTDTLAGTTWDIVEVTMNGTTLTKEQMEAQYGGQALDMYFYFTDSTVTYYLMGETDTTDYTYENGVVTIDGVSSSVNGSTMYFNTGSESYKLVKR